VAAAAAAALLFNECQHLTLLSITDLERSCAAQVLSKAIYFFFKFYLNEKKQRAVGYYASIMKQ